MLPTVIGVFGEGETTDSYKNRMGNFAWGFVQILVDMQRSVFERLYIRIKKQWEIFFYLPHTLVTKLQLNGFWQCPEQSAKFTNGLSDIRLLR